MRVEDIQQRLQDVDVEVFSLDSLKETYDDVNVHIIEDRITELQTEKFNLQQLLGSCFNEIIGL